MIVASLLGQELFAYNVRFTDSDLTKVAEDKYINLIIFIVNYI